MKFAALAGALSIFATCGNAASLSLNSNATETTNNSGSPTMNIPQNPAWANPVAGSSWVSYLQSGDPNAPGYTSPANGTVVAFTETFTIKGAPMGGMLHVLADDSASVILNGVTLMSEATQSGNTYGTCSDFAIGCLTRTEGNIDLTSALRSGLNTLTFDVAQRAGSSFGLDYAGTVNYSDAPEPASFGLLGLSLLGLLFKRCKRATNEGEQLARG
jgi:PEP-CTERM motif